MGLRWSFWLFRQFRRYLYSREIGWRIRCIRVFSNFAFLELVCLGSIHTCTDHFIKFLKEQMSKNSLTYYVLSILVTFQALRPEYENIRLNLTLTPISLRLNFWTLFLVGLGVKVTSILRSSHKIFPCVCSTSVILPVNDFGLFTYQ